jgi:hypothetical protein
VTAISALVLSFIMWLDPIILKLLKLFPFFFFFFFFFPVCVHHFFPPARIICPCGIFFSQTFAFIFLKRELLRLLYELIHLSFRKLE